MKKTYSTPLTEVVAAATGRFMETISLPTTGHVDNPSFGQSKGQVIENGHLQGQSNIWDD